METKQPSSNRRPLELYVQPVTAASLLIGIILVMVELEQTRQMTATEIITARLASNVDHHSKVYGENLGTTLAKACRKPEELSDAEAFALDVYFHNHLTIIYMNLSAAGISEGIGWSDDWKRISEGSVHQVLSYPSGKIWLEKHPYWGSKEEAKRDEVVAWVQSFKGISPFDFECHDVPAAFIRPNV